nr:MAG TPA: hypothetical protein [Caudoviricetes sp.]
MLTLTQTFKESFKNLLNLCNNFVESIKPL